MSDQQELINANHEHKKLSRLVTMALERAKQQGASAAEVGTSTDAGFSVDVRLGDVETVEFNQDQGIGITVYFGQKKGTASTSDCSDEAIATAVDAACRIARYTSEDQYSGLAEAKLMAGSTVDVDLYHPWDLGTEQAIEMAIACEQAGRNLHKEISNSDGASVSTYQSYRFYGNSHGFMEGYPSSRHSASCMLIAKRGEEMQRDYWHHSARDVAEIPSLESIGIKAAERTLQRLGSRKIKSTTAAVVFSPEMANSLIRSGLGALSGGALYRKSSFLMDSLGSSVFADHLSIEERPQLLKGSGSAPFDQDGLATTDKHFIRNGVVESYLLSTYSARKLSMDSTANAGGARNVFVHSDSMVSDVLAEMGTGLLVTELMGQGVNMVTGDYSRGAAGFWVENGKVQYPVHEITIAGNLKDIFQNILAMGADVDHRGNLHCGSLLIKQMIIGGA